MKQGMYSSIPDEVYHKDPCDTPSASASILATLYQQSPLHAWTAHPRLNPNYEPRKSSPEQAFGTAAHAMLLGNRKVVGVNATDWRTKEAKATRDMIEAQGHIALKIADLQRVSQMVETLKDGLSKHDLGNPFDDGNAEATVIWYDDGKPIRGRCDWWNGSRKLIVDYKTVSGSAHPEAWSRQLFNLGSDFQAALYPQGVRAALGLDKEPDFVFVVQETEPPYAFSVYRLDEQTKAMAVNKVAEAYGEWRTCLEANRWPGYSRRIVSIGAPVYELKREETRALARSAELIVDQG
jgi:hypothetical protein